MARECGCVTDSDGIRVTQGDVCGREILRVQIKSEAAAGRVGKPCGRYVTVFVGDVTERGGMAAFDEAVRVLAVELKEMAERLTGKRITAGFSLLAVGLGNSDMTPDALGPATVRRLTVTRHQGGDKPLPGSLRLCEISAFSPGVSGQTGLETVEMVRGAAEAVKPDLVLAIDALAAKETAHLGATVQLSDAGIQPGAGVGGGRPALTLQALGVPVLALGVPTVVDSDTLVEDALRRFGLDEEMPGFAELVRGGKRFFVTPKDIDLLLPLLATLLSDAIHKAFFVTE